MQETLAVLDFLVYDARMPTPIEILKGQFETLGGIAKAAGVKSYQNVQQWNGVVPPELVLTLCEASSWAITPHMLRADLYPNPDDALPASLKTAA